MKVWPLRSPRRTLFFSTPPLNLSHTEANTYTCKTSLRICASSYVFVCPLFCTQTQKLATTSCQGGFGEAAVQTTWYQLCRHRHNHAMIDQSKYNPVNNCDNFKAHISCMPWDESVYAQTKMESARRLAKGGQKAILHLRDTETNT